MSGAEGYVNDPPASITEDSTAATKDTIPALLKAIKNLQIDIAAFNQVLAGAVSAGKVQCDTELTITGEGLATQTTLAAVLAKISSDPATAAGVAALLTGIVLANGENHIGSVGGHTAVVTVTPTITAGTYSAGYLVGGLMTVANAARVAAGKGTIQSVVLTDKAKQDMPIDIIFFQTNLPNSTLTDHVALTIHDTDLLACIGVVKILASDYSDFADNSVASKTSQGLPFAAAAGSTTIYAVAVARDAPVYASTSDLQFKFKIYPD